MRVSVHKAQQQVHSSAHAWQNRVLTNPYIFVKGQETQFLLHTSSPLLEVVSDVSGQIHHSAEIQEK